MPAPALQEVTRTTKMALLTHAFPAWWGYLTAEDRDRIDCFYQQIIRGGFLPSDSPSVYTLSQRADDALFGAIIPRGLGGVVMIDAAIGAHRRGSRPVHYLTVAATLDKSLTSHCL